jgi:hypothetical protein
MAQLRTDTELVRIEGSNALLQVSDRLMPILTPEIQRVMQAKISVAARSPLYLHVQPPDHADTTVSRALVSDAPLAERTGSFEVPGTGLASAQIWQAVQQSLAAGGSIPRSELTMWASSSELLAVTGETFVLGFANGFLCRRAEHRLRDLEREFAYVAGFTCRVEIVEIDLWRERGMRGA